MPTLKVSLEAATNELDNRIHLGNELLKVSITSKSQLDEERSKYYKWNDYNITLLIKLFDNNVISDEYSMGIGFAIIGTSSIRKDIDDHYKDIKNKIDNLESIKERLPLYIEDDPIPIQKKPAKVTNNKVFIVHGHDNEPKMEVTRIIEKLGLNAIVLHERPNAGQTVIEKLEANSDVGFAIIILTPDDEGKSKKDQKLNPRARQNVIAELGYFVAKLGRNRVCPLYIEGVEIPSDFSGVLYVKIDEGFWKFKLVQELKAAGFDVDSNVLLN